MTKFLHFCQKHYHAALTFFVIGGAMACASRYLPHSIEPYGEISGLLVCLISSVVLAIGLIREGREG
jgi:ABC-type Fe3+ transport system permease subunit